MSTVIANPDGTITARKVFKPSELLAHSFQFCEELVKAEMTFDELREDFKASEYANKEKGKVAVIFTDNSAVTFTYGSREMIAHDRDQLDKVFQ